MSDKTRPAREQRHDHGECRAWMSEHLNREQRATDWADHGMDGVPDGIDPRDFVCEKFEKIKNAGNDDHGGMPENIERLVVGTERNPVKMNGEPGRENGEVKIDSGQRSETERNAEQI